MLRRTALSLIFLSLSTAAWAQGKTFLQIPLGTTPTLADTFIGVHPPNIDTRWSLSQIQSTLGLPAYVPANLSGLDTSFTGTISGGSGNLVITATDFKVGQGIWIPGAGASNTAAIPTTGSVAVTCVSACSSTLVYKLAGRDANGGVSAVSSAMTANSSAATNALAYSRDPAVAQNNALTFTCGANDVDVLIYRGSALIGDVPCSDAGFTDYGQLAIPSSSSPHGIPNSPSSSPTAAPLITTISAISSTSLTLANTATNGVNNGAVFHDDGTALQTALTAACTNQTLGFISLPAGTYNIHQTLTCIPGSTTQSIMIAGQGGTTLGPSSGTQIRYWGRGDQQVFYADGLNGSTVQDIVFDGNGLAFYVVQLDNSTGSRPSSGNHFFRDHFSYPNSPSNGIAFAANNKACTGGADEVSEIFFLDDFFQGLSAYGATRDGFVAFCGGNTKNFQFTNVEMNFVDFAWEAQSAGASGNWYISGGIVNVGDTMLENLAPVQLYVNSIEAEPQNATRLIIAGPGSNPGAVVLQTIQWNAVAPASGEAFIATNSNRLYVIGNVFGGGQNNASGREFILNSTQPTGQNNGNVTSVFSYGNWYEGSPSQPIFNSGNRSADLTQFPNFQNAGGTVVETLNLISYGDYGGENGALVNFPALNYNNGTQMADQLYLRQLITNSIGPATIPFDWYGGGHFEALTDPPAPTVVINSGSGTSTTYKIVYRTFTGQATNISAGTTVSGGATPNNTVSGRFVKGAWFADIYDTTSGNKIIGTVNVSQFPTLAWSFTDNNATRTSQSPPASNNTATLTVDQSISGQSYIVSSTLGVSCTGTPTSGFTSINGIVTHC